MVKLEKIIKKLWPNRSTNQDSRAKCFDADLNYDGPFYYTESCICRVPLNQIVGSVGKCSAFDNKFSSRSHVPLDRFVRIKQAMRKGKSMPPVNLYKIDEEYYVMDGNHRVAAAKELGHLEIIAKLVNLTPSNGNYSVLKENGYD